MFLFQRYTIVLSDMDSFWKSYRIRSNFIFLARKSSEDFMSSFSVADKRTCSARNCGGQNRRSPRVVQWMFWSLYVYGATLLKTVPNAKSDPRSILRLAVEEDLKTIANLCIERCDKKRLYTVIVIWKPSVMAEAVSLVKTGILVKTLCFLGKTDLC